MQQHHLLYCEPRYEGEDEVRSVFIPSLYIYSNSVPPGRWM